MKLLRLKKEIQSKGRNNLGGQEKECADEYPNDFCFLKNLDNVSKRDFLENKIQKQQANANFSQIDQEFLMIDFLQKYWFF